MRWFLSTLSLRFPENIAYMLQSVEYEIGSYFKWFWRTKDFMSVMTRRTLDRTSVALLFLWFMRLGILFQILIGLLLIYNGAQATQAVLLVIGLVTALLSPVLWAHLIIFPVVIARKLIILPRQRRYQSETRKIMKAHTGLKIAVAGSYGKTTMKELLLTILSEGKKVAATPSNKNVLAAHYSFANSLKGDEEIVIVEFGEGKPGDVETFTKTIDPDIGIITGLAPAHLDQYGTFEAAADDIFSLAKYLRNKQKSIYINTDSRNLDNYLSSKDIAYTSAGIKEWRVENISVEIEGTQFELVSKEDRIGLKSGLLGEHLIGVLSAATVIALKCGLSKEQVISGVAKTKPYKHRMQPYPLSGGWVIDDAYNGNIEGIKAGTQLLKALHAKRKIYVTPGLVDQGEETESVHIKAGKLIAAAKPDIVVLMDNSVTGYIRHGLEAGGYDGDIRIEDEPLAFYTGLEHFIAAGDVCMLQNDWTDNYA